MKRSYILVYFKLFSQQEKRGQVSGLLPSRDKVRDIAKRLDMSSTTIYKVKKHMDDVKGVKRRAESDRNGVVDCNSSPDAIRSNPLTSMRQHARRIGTGTAKAQEAAQGFEASPRSLSKEHGSHQRSAPSP